MERIIQPAINFQIILQEDAAKSSREPTVWHCGDEIQGLLEVTTYGNVEFEVNVSFEGLVRTWIGADNDRNLSHLPPTAECQFLQETQKLYSDPSARSCKGVLSIYRLPFRFVVPHELISARSDVHSDFLKLSPSTKQGLSFRGPGKIFWQPMIIYVIRIIRIRTDKVVENFMTSTYQREITVMPYSPEAPPLVIEAFPREYKCSVTKFLKQRRWRQPLGTLTLSAAEPSPINTLAFGPRPCTFAFLSLVFTSNYPFYFDTRPSEWSCVVRHYLRIRTFYSTRRLDRMPTLAAAKTDPFLKFHDRKTAPEVREYSKMCWNRDETCHWTTTLKIPIRAAKNLLPTFLNQLSARQYAVVLRLSIQGLSHRVIELVLPVQVAYCRPVDSVLEINGGERTGAQDEFLSSVSGVPQELMTLDVDVSPPPYDL